MEFLKELFKNGALTFEQFSEACGSSKIKLANLTDGGYVSKQKYDDDLKAKNTQIDTLTDTISTRDTDLATIKKQLEDAGADKQKLSALTADLSSLQTKYDNDIKTYEEKMSKQAYEFAVKDFAGTKKFSSNAAKRDFINSMIAKNLTMENDKIMGAEDFAAAYSADNADAFVTEDVRPPKPQPSYVLPTPGIPQPSSDGMFNFNFAGVRAHEQKK